jgi:hypothetical protein
LNAIVTATLALLACWSAGAMTIEGEVTASPSNWLLIFVAAGSASASVVMKTDDAATAIAAGPMVMPVIVMVIAVLAARSAPFTLNLKDEPVMTSPSKSGLDPYFSALGEGEVAQYPDGKLSVIVLLTGTRPPADVVKEIVAAPPTLFA